MKSNPLTSILLGILTVSAAASVTLFYLQVAAGREMRRVQPQVMAVQQNRAIIGALINDTVEYSKSNPAILPLLEQVGLKGGKPGAVAAPKTPTR